MCVVYDVVCIWCGIYVWYASVCGGACICSPYAHALVFHAEESICVEARLVFHAEEPICVEDIK